MTDLPIQRILLEGIAQLERAGVPYAVMGGFAARAWGLPRPTYDADIAIIAEGPTLQRVLDALERAGFDVPSEHRTGYLDSVGRFRKARVNMFAGQHVWTTDLFLAEGDFLRGALARALIAKIGDRAVRVMTPEDIILLKLMASRRKDLADIEDIVSICADLDVEYLRRWAASLDIVAALEEFFPRRT